MVDAEDIENLITEYLQDAKERARIKLVILGNGQIGKSTLINYFKHLNLSRVKVRVKS